MAVPVELRVETLLATYEKYANYDSKLAKYFPAVGAENGGNFVKYDVLAYNRSLAPMVAYGARAPKGAMPVRSQVAFEPPTYKESIAFEVEMLKSVRDVGKLTASQQAQVGRAIRQLRLNFDRRKDWLRAQWLTAGQLLTSAGVAPKATSVAGADTVYLDSRYSKTSTPQAIDLGFTASHCDGVVAASWATATTNIKADLDAWKLLIAQDSGVDATHVITNSTVMAYIEACTGSGTRSDNYRQEYDETGKYRKIWGYTFDVIDDQWPFDSLSMATDTGATGMVSLIPGKMLILTSLDNVAAGRMMIECEPSDVRAPQGARGMFMWQDGDWQHPHVPEYGAEWTGAPAITIPDATVVVPDVTSTS